MEEINNHKRDTLSSSLLKLQYRLIAKKYGRLAALFIRSISVRELTAERLLVFQSALIVLSQWVKISDACHQLLLQVQRHLLSSFRYTLLYEIIFFIMQGVVFYGFIAAGLELLNLDIDLVFFILFCVLLTCLIAFVLLTRSFIRFGYLCICSFSWIFIIRTALDWSASVGS